MEFWVGGPVKAVSDDVMDALDILCDYTAAKYADDDAKEIILALDDLGAEWAAFLDAREIARESVRPSGTPELWARYRDVKRAFALPTKRLPEPIRDLMELNPPAGDVQICRMYGFLHDDGSPDFIKLREEKDKPGTHYDAKTWVHPADRRRMAELNERWAKRTPLEQSFSQASEPKPQRIAPESIEELLAQGVGSEQIAGMKGMLREEVITFAEQHGYPVDGRSFSGKPDPHVDPDSHDQQQAILQQRRAELIPQSHPEIEDMEARILASAADGMKPKDIAEALQPTFPDLNWQKAAAIIRASAETASAAA